MELRGNLVIQIHAFLISRIPKALLVICRHFWTGKFEAHLWDNSYIREGHRRKGKQGNVISCCQSPLIKRVTSLHCASY